MKLLLMVCFCCLAQQQIFSQSNLIRSTTGASGSSEQLIRDGHVLMIQQTIGQPSVIGVVGTGDYILRQGFIHPDVLSKIIEKDLPVTLQLSVFPNPFQDQITLQFSENIEDSIRVTVYNILGAQVFTYNYQALQQVDVMLSWLSSGEYIVKTIANKKQFISKVIKK